MESIIAKYTILFSFTRSKQKKTDASKNLEVKFNYENFNPSSNYVRKLQMLSQKYFHLLQIIILLFTAFVMEKGSYIFVTIFKFVRDI